MSPMRGLLKLATLAALTVLLLVLLGRCEGRGQDHAAHRQHPPQDILLHQRFYSTWRRPSGGDCCNNRDCYPTRAVFDETLGLWRAERREDRKMVVIPKSIYDPENPNERQSPDGQSHLCAPPPNTMDRWHIPPNPVELYLHYYLPPKPQDKVYCFTPGEGH